MSTEDQQGNKNFHQYHKAVTGVPTTLEHVYNNIDDVIWVASFHPHRCVYLNKASEKVLGYGLENCAGNPSLFVDSIHPEDRQKFNESVTDAYTSGKSACEFRIIRADGQVRLLKGQALLIKDENGHGDLLTGIASDITDLVGIRKELIEKKEELDAIVENINDSFFTIDELGTITYVNRALENMLEVKREDVVGRNAWELFPAATDTHFYSCFNDCLLKGSPAVFEDYYAPLDKWFNMNVYPGKKGLSVFCADITSEKKAKEDTMRTKRNLRAIIDTTDDLIWSVDRDMRIIEANKAYRRVVYNRYGNGASTGVDVFNNIPDDKKAEWRAYFEKGLQGKPYTIMHESVIEGNTHYSRVSFNPIKDDDGEVIGVSCFSCNITKQCLQMMEIEQKNKLLMDIAYMQSHQVRGPVASIMGLASLFNAHNPADPANKKILEGFLDAAHKLNDVISEIDTKTKYSYEHTQKNTATNDRVFLNG